MGCKEPCNKRAATATCEGADGWMTACFPLIVSSDVALSSYSVLHHKDVVGVGAPVTKKGAVGFALDGSG